MEFLIFILIGILAGWIAEQVMKRDHGILVNLVVGVVGALLGGLIANWFGINWGGTIIGKLVIATLGAILLLFILGLIKKK